MDPQKWIELNKSFIALPPAHILALCAYGEARGEEKPGIQAVLNVVNNRVHIGGWYVEKEIARLSSEYHGVILKPFQFSCFLPGDDNRKLLLWIATDVNSAVSTRKPLALCLDLSIALINGLLEDNTQGATHYHTREVKPPWAAKLVRTAEIGHHIFYKEEPLC